MREPVGVIKIRKFRTMWYYSGFYYSQSVVNNLAGWNFEGSHITSSNMLETDLNFTGRSARPTWAGED